MRRKTVTLLLGAGSSIPAGMPTTQEITDAVLSSEGLDPARKQWIHPFVLELWKVATGYYRKYALRIPDGQPSVEGAAEFRRKLVKGAMNYEVMYYLADQLLAAELGVVDNPAVQPLLEKFTRLHRRLAVQADHRTGIGTSLRDRLEAIADYIKGTVLRKIETATTDTSSLDCLLSPCLNSSVERVDIFTLNHDMVIERWLKDRGLQYCDGFGGVVNDLRYWEPETFDSKETDIRLFKLHGSIDWKLFQTKGTRVQGVYTCICMAGDGPYWTGRAGEQLFVSPPGSRILVGTYNKFMAYNADPFDEVLCRFSDCLRRTTSLTIVGYGFQDRGINVRLSSWLGLADNARVVQIDPAADSLWPFIGGCISDTRNELYKTKEWTSVPKCIEKVEWEEIWSYL